VQRQEKVGTTIGYKKLHLNKKCHKALQDNKNSLRILKLPSEQAEIPLIIRLSSNLEESTTDKHKETHIVTINLRKAKNLFKLRILTPLLRVLMTKNCARIYPNRSSHLFLTKYRNLFRRLKKNVS
jgi:hypothetical protein